MTREDTVLNRPRGGRRRRAAPVEFERSIGRALLTAQRKVPARGKISKAGPALACSSNSYALMRAQRPDFGHARLLVCSMRRTITPGVGERLRLRLPLT